MPVISPLFKPLQIRGLNIPNRLVISPMCQYSAGDGLANDWHLVHLGKFAQGGAGIVFTEASLTKKHKDVLGNLSLMVERTVLSGGRGTYYRMQAGPIASWNQATSLCSRLKQRKLGCLVVRR